MTKLDQESKTMLPRVGWVLYDGGCGFCFRWVHFWERTIERRGFFLKDLQSAWEDGSLKRSQQNLLDDILVLTQDGKLESGGHGHSMQSFAYPVLIGCFGKAIAGSIVTDTASLATAPYHREAILAT